MLLVLGLVVGIAVVLLVLVLVLPLLTVGSTGGALDVAVWEAAGGISESGTPKFWDGA